LYYLQEKYETENPNLLKQHVYDNIMEPLGRRSAPMFWSESSQFIAAAKTMGYLSVPNISQAITGAAQDYIGEHRQDDISQRASWSMDRISVFQFICGVPLFSYKGVSNYLSTYKEKSRLIVGVHLYEYTQRDPRDDRMLVDIIPVSRIEKSQLNDSMKAAIEDYEKAVRYGVISAVQKGTAGDEYHLNTLDTAVISQWSQDLSDVIVSGKAAVIKAAAAQAEERLKALPIVSYRVIPNNGASGYEELVVRDHVVDSLEHVQTLREQVAVAEAYEAVIEKAGVGIDSEQKFRDAVRMFTEAMETGVIRSENGYTYTYVTVSYGIEDTVELTNVDSEPYGQNIPVYSAFEAYMALKESERADIAANVRDVLVNKPEQISEALALVQGNLSPNKINIYVDRAKTNYQANAATILKFFQLANAELTTFSAMHS
jgi:hypothetical protein